MTDRKRTKVQLMGTFADYQSSKKKPVPSSAHPVANAAPPLHFANPGPPSTIPMFLNQTNQSQGKKDAEMKKTK